MCLRTNANAAHAFVHYDACFYGAVFEVLTPECRRLARLKFYFTCHNEHERARELAAGYIGVRASGLLASFGRSAIWTSASRAD